MNKINRHQFGEYASALNRAIKTFAICLALCPQDTKDFIIKKREIFIPYHWDSRILKRVGVILTVLLYPGVQKYATVFIHMCKIFYRSRILGSLLFYFRGGDKLSTDLLNLSYVHIFFNKMK